MGKKRVVSIVLAVVLLVAISLSVLANSQNVDVLFDNISIYLDGKKVASDVEPFVYKERTYTPARMVAEALGATVTWDAKTNRVNIKSPVQTANPTVAEGVKKVLSSSLTTVDSLGVLILINDINSVMLAEYRNDLEFYNIWGMILNRSSTGYSKLITETESCVTNYNKSQEVAIKFLDFCIKEADNKEVANCATKLKADIATMSDAMVKLKAYIHAPTKTDYENIYDLIDDISKARNENSKTTLKLADTLWGDYFDAVDKYNSDNTTSQNSSTDSKDLFGGLDDLFKSSPMNANWMETKELILNSKPKLDAKAFVDEIGK